ncbi:MAG TPA: phosphopantothenoylcysteine decarboxylase [Spirochaetota bacterium]|nr:phosphopantothenoylcysteine decarboxylase [Spirochaetota bacterium]HPI24133.1 phosphopantothenoylcysteine decarboxylase [Spirochaetota bacterium]
MRLAGKKIIVTGGPTREWLDPVRFLSNASTGKMGVAIADEAARISGEVVFVHGPMREELYAGREYRMIGVETTVELRDAVVGQLAPGCVLIMAAAPADFTPVETSSKKIKKTAGADEIALRLKKTPDILKGVADIRHRDPGLRDIVVVGFAAETNDIETYAKQKLVEKRLEMICLNDVGRVGAGFGTDTNVVTMFTKHGRRIELPLLSKEETARRILEEVDQLMERSNQIGHSAGAY